MLTEIAFQIAKRRVCRTERHDSSPRAKGVTSAANYRQWRSDVLKQEFLAAFGGAIIRDKDVLDFGCGTGDLSLLLPKLGARSCIGVDIQRDMLDRAATETRGQPVSFAHASDPTTVPLGAASVDTIVCIDVMEHVMEYESIMREWRRILRPNGKVLIHWQPWFHPHGHHGHDYIPIPWIHVFLNNRKRTQICSRIVDLPEFDPPWWDLDENGKRVNRFRPMLEKGAAEKSRFLNQLTMRRFERVCRDVPLNIEKRELVSFRGPAIVRATSSCLKHIPFVREFFTANVIYILSR